MLISFDTTFLDYPDPTSLAVVVIMSGCEHHCLGCQNPILQKTHTAWTEGEILGIIEVLQDKCKRNDTNKIVLSGGDPLHPCNRDLSTSICSILGATHDICIYTGYSIEEVKSMSIRGFKYIKCGKYDKDNTQLSEKTDDYIQFVNKTQNLYNNNYEKLSSDGRFIFNLGVNDA